MGVISLPASGRAYLDTNPFIYTIERVDPYRAPLDDFWRDVSTSRASVLTSELTLLETLVKPIRQGDAVLEATFRAVLSSSPDVRMLPITISILIRAARLRAAYQGLKTPDALHAATALEHGCALFLTNDPGFRRIPGLPITVLSDLLP